MALATSKSSLTRCIHQDDFLSLAAQRRVEQNSFSSSSVVAIQMAREFGFLFFFFFGLPLSQIRGHVLPHCFPTQPQPWSRGSLFLFEVVTSGTLEIVSEGEEE